MINPPVSSLLKKTGDRYTLVIATAKRARQLTEGAKILSNTKADNNVSLAINEIDEGKITFYKIKKH